MRTFMNLLVWDFKLLAKYNIVTVAIVITVLYIAILKLLPFDELTDLVIILIFTDPTAMGFIFIGVIVLFEKSANTLEAIVVTPIKSWQYLFSKSVALTLIALLCSFFMAFAGHGFQFNYFYFTLAVVLSSILFTLIGFIGVSKVKTFNEYIIKIPIFLSPIALPFFNFFEVTDSYFFYIIPPQASLILFNASFKHEEPGQIIYAILFLLISIFITYIITKKQYEKHIVRQAK